MIYEMQIAGHSQAKTKKSVYEKLRTCRGRKEYETMRFPVFWQTMNVRQMNSELFQMYKAHQANKEDDSRAGMIRVWFCNKDSKDVRMMIEELLVERARTSVAKYR